MYDEKRAEVETFLRTFIAKNETYDNAKIPSGNALAEMFSVNRNTIRTVVNKLINEGILRSERGSGVYIVSKPSQFVYHHTQDSGFSDQFRQSGRKYDFSIVSSDIVKPNEKLRKMLGLTHSQRVYTIKSVRSVDEVPFAVCTSCLPQFLVPGLDEHLHTGLSINDIITGKYGYAHPVCDSFAAKATLPVAEEVKYLGIGQSTPILETQELFSVPGVGKIEFFRVRARADRFTVLFGSGEMF